ncbi:MULTISPECIES: type I glyceraldehyde-3-phosphate dehydrogenase [Marinobacterium]|jgi:glyceraldehyde 3-phosphate dehydrogenase|uniref:Glyceraldehyde-3-phosphate dehydrogenase n=1 Tax=Marinobacterium iners DSM 11526 TaxID=1122198 RepID=A0A1H4AXA2_9GAMM|nr:type I glyceraldehyde-3-phosphate dehydrogenase [Marinobacterium iners]QSR35211.1 type I glyceraldehyde-3-phosphate dehydrogenase [Marinobacterium iners]SEA40511.1 glyceraldehyde-3-phosphate dehydrogenase (NAD+) [Marinobacterium iners DSM 11526]
MAIRIAINGYGRIGRNILRALYESGREQEFEVVAINDLGDSAISAHLTEYDSVHGRFMWPVRAEKDRLILGEHSIRMLREPDPHALPWRELGVDIVFECTGRFTDREQASIHLQQGAGKVLVSAPAKGADATIVFGVNESILTSEHQVVSNASCTTNCLAPMAKALNDSIGIQQGLMTTIHSYTNDQHLTDVYHTDLYRARAAALSMIPTKTGAAKAVGLVLPELDGRLSGLAVRVPTANVSLVDLTFTANRNTTVEEVNAIMKRAAEASKGIIEYNSTPLVSIDFNHHSASTIYDSLQTQVLGSMVKVFAWYDNEWGFSNRMLDTASCMHKTS